MTYFGKVMIKVKKLNILSSREISRASNPEMLARVIASKGNVPPAIVAEVSRSCQYWHEWNHYWREHNRRVVKAHALTLR